MSDILDDLENLHKQATTERSHYYVADCCKRAIIKIKELREALNTCRELRVYDSKRLRELESKNGGRG